MSLGLYLHIPYCFSKCRYCDFYSHPGERGVPDAYVEALVRELDRFAPERPLQPDTLYFGGGTPSLLRPEQAKRLIDAARPMPGAEITLEANPETVTEQSLAGFREAGVNRISFGVQSARDTQLRTLGRPHTAKQARAAFAAARRAGFANISGDIMLALPHYTEAEFDETLELIEEGGATHISAYLLKIEPNTVFGKRPPEALPDDDAAADFYLAAVEKLAALVENREKLQVGTTGKTIVFTKENFSFAARIMEGPYLAVSQVLSNLKQQFTVLTDAALLRDTILQALSVTGTQNRFSLSFAGNRLAVRCESEYGVSETALDVVALSGEPVGLYWYNPAQLMECLKALNGTLMLEVVQHGALLLKTDELVCFQTAVREPKAIEMKPQKTKKPRKEAA